MNFSQRRRQNLWAALRWCVTLVSAAVALLAATVIPMLVGWWDTALPAAIATAIAALALFAVLVSAPLEAVAYVALYTDRPVAAPPRGFGRAIFRIEALSQFESADPLQTKQPPVWHEARDALQVVERLLKEADAKQRPHLLYLRSALEASGGKFYFMVKTWAGGTNARVEALRRGDMSVIAPR